MAVAVIMPKQGQSVETCVITEWVKKKGDTIRKGDVLFTYETDKASFETEAEAEGILLDQFYSEGDEVPVLTNVAVIGNAGEETEPFRPGSLITKTADTKNDSPQPSVITQEDKKLTISVVPSKMKISPRARIMAEKLGIDLHSIQGSGPNYRIIARDIEIAAQSKKTSGIATNNNVKDQHSPQTYLTPSTSAFYTDADCEVKKISNVRKLIAKAMQESINNSAQLTHHMSADVRALLALRAKYKTEADNGGVNITLNDMICFAVIRALEKHPDVNSHFLGDQIKTFKKIHMGIAVDTPRGLMVPSVQNASDLSLKGLSNRLKETADQCKKGSVNPEVLSSSSASFTVSNLGNYGVEMFTPIINLPQVAILGVNTIVYRPADLGQGTFGFIPVIGLSLTYDHRAIDGGPATLFLREIKQQIENFKDTY